MPYHSTPFHTYTMPHPSHVTPHRTLPHHKHTLVHYTAPYSSIPHHTTPHHKHTLGYHTIPYHFIQFHSTPHHTYTTAHHTISIPWAGRGTSRRRPSKRDGPPAEGRRGRTSIPVGDQPPGVGPAAVSGQGGAHIIRSREDTARQQILGMIYIYIYII